MTMNRYRVLAVLALVACSGDGNPPTAPESPRLSLISGDGQTGEVGASTADPFVVRLTSGVLPLVGRYVVFRDVLGGADSALTDGSGEASVRWQLPRMAGAYEVDASSTITANGRTEIPRASFHVTAFAGPPDKLEALSPDSELVAVGAEVDRLVVQAIDRFTNPVRSAPVTWTIESGGGSLSAASVKTDDRGVASAVWTVGPVPGRNSIILTVGPATIQFVATASNQLFRASSIVSGVDHTCALDVAGAAYCWGANESGQLGTGVRSNAPSLNPVKVAGGLTFVSLSAGASHTCGLTRNGDAFCWGADPVGQLGTGTGAGVPAATPTKVALEVPFSALAAGYDHTCGLTTTGRAYCWGDGKFGQLGDGSNRTQLRPEPVKTEEQFTALSAGRDFSCAVSVTGVAYCWGSDQDHQLGAGVPVSCVTDVIVDYYGYDYTEVYSPCSGVPLRVDLPTTVTSIVSGANASCSVTASGDPACWGNGAAPRQLAAPRHASAMSVGLGTVCGLDDGGAVRCSSFDGETSNVELPAGLAFAQLSGSASHVCAIARGDLSVAYCWGTNAFGVLGDGTRKSRDTPVSVVAPPLP